MTSVNPFLLQEFIRGHFVGPIGFIFCVILLVYIEKHLRLPEREKMNGWLKFDTRVLLISAAVYYVVVTGDFLYRYYITKSQLTTRYFTLASSFTTLITKSMIVFIFFFRADLSFRNTAYQIPKIYMYALVLVLSLLFVTIQVLEAFLWRSFFVYVMRSVAVATDFTIQVLLLFILCSRLIRMNNAQWTGPVVGASKNAYIFLTVRYILMVTLCLVTSILIAALSFLVDRWYGEADVFFGVLSCILVYNFPLTNRMYKILCCCHSAIEQALELTVHLAEETIPESVGTQSTESADDKPSVRKVPRMDIKDTNAIDRATETVCLSAHNSDDSDTGTVES